MKDTAEKTNIDVTQITKVSSHAYTSGWDNRYLIVYTF